MTTSIGAPSFPFPHPQLTQVVGKPTAITIKQLRKEIYANARLVHSERGGGANGYLGIVMETAPYLARAGEAFILPNHTRHTIIQYKIVACTPVLFFRIDSSDYKRYRKFRGPSAHCNTENLPIDYIDYKESRKFRSRPARNNTKNK
jgi:hypothetical protein